MTDYLPSIFWFFAACVVLCVLVVARGFDRKGAAR